MPLSGLKNMGEGLGFRDRGTEGRKYPNFPLFDFKVYRQQKTKVL